MNSERSVRRALGLALLLTVGLVGCFEENLPEQNLDGTVVLPGDLVDDPRYAGVVFVGIYEGFDPEQLGYPYPATGPRVGDNPIGDALPYGGSTVGDYAYGCVQSLRCQIVSGRYSTLDGLLEVNPVQDEEGEDLDDEDMFDQCSYYYGWNSIQEFSFLGPDQLDFTQNEDGDWVAPFRAWHSLLPEGALLWAFADNDFTSCSVNQGQINRRRGEDGQFFREGTNFSDVLNFPDKYITDGDLVSTTPVALEADRTEGYQLVLDYVKD